MVGPKLYHLKHTRQFKGFNDPSRVVNNLCGWLDRQGFYCRIKNSNYAHGRKRGIHANHVGKCKLYVTHKSDGSFMVTFDYYCKVKLGSALVVGVLTLGVSVSTAIGLGTLAYNMVEADKFVDKFWKFADSLGICPATILCVERWGSDGKGNMVLQPLPVAQPVHPIQAPQPVQPVIQHVPIQPQPVQQRVQPVASVQPAQSSYYPHIYSHPAPQAPQAQLQAQPLYYPHMQYSPQSPSPQQQQQFYYPPTQYNSLQPNYTPAFPNYYPSLEQQVKH